MRKRLDVLLVAAVGLVFSWTLGCEAFKEATEKVIENEVGCSEAQLGDLDEPDLPYCSKAVACCKFLKGECGQVQLFTPPDEVLQACNANEAVLAEAIHQYQGISEGDCPAYLSQEGCQGGVEETRENYRKVVDQGQSGLGSGTAPSCQLIVDETVNRLNEELGDGASFLPEACEAVAVTVPGPGDDVVEDVTGDAAN